jgi:transcriptional regulator with XRE-family HTH domain
VTGVNWNLLQTVTPTATSTYGWSALLLATMTAQQLVLIRLKQQGITEEQLQREFGIKRPMANMILNGRRKIAVRHLDRLPHVLGLPLWKIFDERDLIRPSGDRTLGVHSHGVSSAPEPVDPRIQKLEAERDELKQRIDDITRVTRALFALVRPSEENGVRRTDKPRRGRPRGKTA